MAKLTRRNFLMATGWTAGGVTALYLLRERAIAHGPSIIFPNTQSGASWVQIKSDGKCLMFLPRMEMGQNVNTGLAQIVAEELNISVEDILGITPNTSEVPPIAFTAGSLSMTLFSRPTAHAAATLREAMRARAAKLLKLPIDAVMDAEGGFKAANNRTVSYADLVDETNVVVEFDDQQAPPALYTFDAQRQKKQVGQDVKPLNIRALVTGGAIFSGDVPMPDVLFGRTIKPPVRNASLATLETNGVSNVRGFVELVRDGDFVGVVCKTPGSVDAAMALIKATWSLQQPINQSEIDRLIDVDANMAAGDLEHVLKDHAHRSAVKWAIDLRFDVQTQTHAMQEPRSAIAVFATQGPEKLEIWTGTQDPWAIKRLAAMDMGMAEEAVVVYPQRMGGGFGGREHYDVELDAVRLARAVKRPVKVQWTREDEFTTARNRPASAHRIRLATGAQGQLTDWWHGYITGHIFLARDRLPGWVMPVKRLEDDLGVVRGAQPPYAAAHLRVECSDVDFPIDLGVWRALNAGPAIFAMESAMDELAILQDKDPVDFKIASMNGEHPRLQACLERVRALAEIETLAEGSGNGRGFACGIYEHRCFVAMSADIYIDEQTQKIRVERMCVVQDVGMAVNPGQLRAQVESNVAWSVGMALMERFEVGDDNILSSNFNNYTIPRMEDMPRLEIEIINQPTIPPAGAGEVALIAGPAAITNAIRRATGFRALSLPVTFSDIKNI